MKTSFHVVSPPNAQLDFDEIQTNTNLFVPKIKIFSLFEMAVYMNECKAIEQNTIPNRT